MLKILFSSLWKNKKQRNKLKQNKGGLCCVWIWIGCSLQFRKEKTRPSGWLVGLSVCLLVLISKRIHKIYGVEGKLIQEWVQGPGIQFHSFVSASNPLSCRSFKLLSPWLSENSNYNSEKPGSPSSIHWLHCSTIVYVHSDS